MRRDEESRRDGRLPPSGADAGASVRFFAERDVRGCSSAADLVAGAGTGCERGGGVGEGWRFHARSRSLRSDRSESESASSMLARVAGPEGARKAAKNTARGRRRRQRRWSHLAKVKCGAYSDLCEALVLPTIPSISHSEPCGGLPPPRRRSRPRRLAPSLPPPGCRGVRKGCSLALLGGSPLPTAPAPARPALLLLPRLANPHLAPSPRPLPSLRPSSQATSRRAPSSTSETAGSPSIASSARASRPAPPSRTRDDDGEPSCLPLAAWTESSSSTAAFECLVPC